MAGETRSAGPYSKATMRKLVIAAVVLDVIVGAIAVKYAIDGHAAAPMLLGLAGALIAVLLLTVPLAKRRGRL
ncbi:hypothetical protein [Actinoplanes xinjiangensis]|jgi:uncharacterized membrane protein YeaQ/YmgE (transglycosylase-associated protein family)|uniref:Uncharacterized protein n=1 Tax=Actinoplanes xinjiangensis TaxID=512350 RepID=A0A316F9Z7_9ACTN|nr:hypothetical protein [Actinoplanes xinjiangensis]PWK45105.1 hypothetical protein BC793_11178 [Actinoplanes xinjiangensis]GIF41559.1 hypothetical protein Axi01nite_58700 [Actinoplanes xinjiangensis]